MNPACGSGRRREWQRRSWPLTTRRASGNWWA
jgi:hypothetical protein